MFAYGDDFDKDVYDSEIGWNSSLKKERVCIQIMPEKNIKQMKDF
jgi:hypothetical protein